MNDESTVNLPHPAYLGKVLFGLTMLAIIILSAHWLPISDLSAIQQRLALVVLLVLSLAIIPIVRWVYLRMDELQRSLHTSSTRTTLAVLASLLCLIGVLQANNIIPLFSQFWTFGGLVALWGFNLMLSDLRFK